MTFGTAWRRAAMAGAIVAMGFSISCSEADPVPPSNGTIALSVQASTTGTGRYESVTFPISQFKVRPVDELGNAVFGSLAIGLTNTTIAGNLASGTATIATTTALPAGRYKIDLLVVGSPVLTDSTVPLPAPTNCIENFATVPAATGAQIGAVGYVESDLTDPSWILEVSSGAQQIAVTVNAPAFVQLVEDSFTCVDEGGSATLTSFDYAAYRDGLLPLMALRK
jgi:hypothetical protein